MPEYFVLCSNGKDVPTLKQWQPTPIVSALSPESVRIVSGYKAHKKQKVAVAFETSFLLAKPNRCPTFHGQQFSMGKFL